jgi:hypothetical protein
MRFVLIEPQNCSVKMVDTTMAEAYQRMGLEPSEVDHGILMPAENDRPGLAVVVYQFSLRVPARTQRWWQLGNQLYGGNAVIYAFSKNGVTVNMDLVPPVVFFGNVDAVQEAINKGQLVKPAMYLDNQCIWEWSMEQ